MALTAWSSLTTLVKTKVQNTLMFVKGVGVDEVYPLEVDPATGKLPVDATFSYAGLASVIVYTNDNSGASITTAAYTQITAATAATINNLFIADTSGSFFIIATGAAGFEVDKLYLPPGGGTYNLTVASGTRLSVKALDVNMASGRLVLTALG